VDAIDNIRYSSLPRYSVLNFSSSSANTNKVKESKAVPLPPCRRQRREDI
jgi:hypothetical protein